VPRGAIGSEGRKQRTAGRPNSQTTSSTRDICNHHIHYTQPINQSLS